MFFWVIFVSVQLDADSCPTAKRQRIENLKEMLDGIELQAGIPLNKLGHDSLRGLIRKYTKVYHMLKKYFF